MPNVLITGSNGFIGKNFHSYLKNFNQYSISTFSKKDNHKNLIKILFNIDFIFHFAGINRTKNILEFKKNNIDLTKILIDQIKIVLKSSKKKITIIFTSSIQATNGTPYGKSKLIAEKLLLNFADKYPVNVYILRLNNIFGKWCKPNYNSVVATFCYNIYNNLPIYIDDYNSKIKLTYIDDLINFFLDILNNKKIKKNPNKIVIFNKGYNCTVGRLANLIHKFNSNRKLGIIENAASGFSKALYSTYLSYLEPKNFHYEIIKHSDHRGDFVEVFKSLNNGQISFFTSFPGISRGNHYHNSKSEKFIVIQGTAKFSFKSVYSNKKYSINLSDKKLSVIDTVPGWAHKITNIGSNILIILVWSNEIFDQNNPDTFSIKM